MRIYSGVMPHPLSEVVLSAFTAEKKCFDPGTLAPVLAGTMDPRIRGSKRNVFTAYRTVAEHVLGSLLQDGRLRRDSQGWYVLPS